MVLCTLHSNCYFRFLTRIFVSLKIAINDPVDEFYFYIPYKMESTNTTNCLLEQASVRRFQLGWVTTSFVYCRFVMYRN